MNTKITSVLSRLGKGVLGAADIAAKDGIPIASQIDSIADAVKNMHAKNELDTESVSKIVVSLQELKTAVPSTVQSPKGMLESNRFKMTIIGMGVALLGSWGFPPDAAQPLMEIVFYFVATYVLGDTLRGSVKTEKN